MKKGLSAYWWCQIAGWGTFFFIVTFFYFFVPRLTDFPVYFGVIITTLIGIFTSHLMRGFIIKANLLNLNIAKQFVAIVLISVLFSVVFLILSWLPEPLYLYFNTNYTYKFNFRETIVTSIYLNAQFFGIWNFIYFIYHHVQKSRNHLIETVRLESELKIKHLESDKAQIEYQRNIGNFYLTALRCQMNPHFIFNCLNSIKLYSLENDSASASEYITKFSKLIRLVLENSSKGKIMLSSELDMLRLYIELEAMRFKEKLSFNIYVEKDVVPDYIELPPLLLQPYVENAIWHGLMPKEEGGKIDIEVSMNNEKSLLKLVVTDNGIGRASSTDLGNAKPTNRQSYGIKVTSDRIDLINQVYGAGAEASILDLMDDAGKAFRHKSDYSNTCIMKLRTIIIDDEPDSVKLLQLQLAQSCPQVEIVSTYNSSVKAANEIESLEPDLLFLDIEMPVISGFELLKKYHISASVLYLLLLIINMR